MKDSTSKLLGLEEAIVQNVEEADGGLLVDVDLPRRVHRCPDCGRWTDRVHDYRVQRVCFGLRNFEHFRNRSLFCSTYA